MDFELYYKAVDADQRYGSELVRVYGNRAGDARYYTKHDDRGVIEARDSKRAADDAWHSYVWQVRHNSR